MMRSSGERTLLLTLKEQGSALREKALSVPQVMQGCLNLEPEEMRQLKKLLNKAMARMNDE